MRFWDIWALSGTRGAIDVSIAYRKYQHGGLEAPNHHVDISGIGGITWYSRCNFTNI